MYKKQKQKKQKNYHKNKQRNNDNIKGAGSLGKTRECRP